MERVRTPFATAAGASDGLACFAAVTAAGMKHQPIITGGGRPEEPGFKWVNTTLGNIKSAITGTCRAVRPRHCARYLAAYEYRFNRRFELDRMVERLAAVAANTAPHPLGHRSSGDARVIRKIFVMTATISHRILSVLLKTG